MVTSVYKYKNIYTTIYVLVFIQYITLEILVTDIVSVDVRQPAMKETNLYFIYIYTGIYPINAEKAKIYANICFFAVLTTVVALEFRRNTLH